MDARVKALLQEARKVGGKLLEGLDEAAERGRIILDEFGQRARGELHQNPRG